VQFPQLQEAAMKKQPMTVNQEFTVRSALFIFGPIIAVLMAVLMLGAFWYWAFWGDINDMRSGKNVLTGKRPS
jgi:cytochrome bd-type quinol oxidase subunit 2